MSVAVAVRKNNKIVIAAETQYNYGDATYAVDNYRCQKIIKVGSAYIASTGWSLYENIFEDYLSKQKAINLSNRNQIFAFFIKFWKNLKKNYSFVEDQSDEDESPFAHLDASFLIINKKGIFHVSANMTVTEFEKYYSVGSGSDYSFGALHALYSQKMSPEDIARKAVQAAMNFDIYCGGEIDIFTLKVS